MTNFQDINKRREEEARRERILAAMRAAPEEFPGNGNPTGGSFLSAFRRSSPSSNGGSLNDVPTQGAPRYGSMEVRTGELEGIAPRPSGPRGFAEAFGRRMRTSGDQSGNNAVIELILSGGQQTSGSPSTAQPRQPDNRKRTDQAPQPNSQNILQQPRPEISDLLRRTPGFAGGTLQDQIDRQPRGGRELPAGVDPNSSVIREAPTVLDDEGYVSGTLSRNSMPPALGQSPRGQVLTPQNQQAITRPRLTGGSFRDRFLKNSQGKSEQPITEPRPNGPSSGLDQLPPEMRAPRVGSSGEPFGSRSRRTQPRDVVSDDLQYLRDVEGQPRNKKERFIELLDVVSEAGFGNKPRRTMTPREREIARTHGRLERELGAGRVQAQIANDQAAIYDRRNKAPSGSTRVIEEGEYPDLPAGTEIRQIWNAQQGEMVDHIGRNGRPLIAKARPVERELAPEIKYDASNHAVLVPKDGSPARPIFNHDGTPLTKRANESGNVQTAYRLEPDGITQIQIERNDKGEWVDSVGPNSRRIVRGNVGRIDPDSGAPMSALVTAGRISERERQENQRKAQAYSQEEQEWSGKETNFRQNKANEDSAIQAKSDQLSKLYQEEAGGSILNRGGRTREAIDTDIARVKKELEIHRDNAKRFQEEADKAAGAATEARRNRSLHNDNSPGASQRAPAQRKAPARDGKFHYTRAEIEAAAKSQGKDPSAAVKAMQGRKDVVID